MLKLSSVSFNVEMVLFVCLFVNPAPDYGPYELNLYADSSNFFLMLNKYLEGGDPETEVIDNPRAGDEMIDILGDRYPAKAVTKNIELIYFCFKKFLRLGDLCSESLRVD
ncbi:hypothetical protein [Pseudomonas sp. NFIX28]|uniref:DUF6911 family protein n=1 Tax=Pseudomonas sp. NFIX28 TaxID=1566235 RepID=UPI000A82585C|nr:hypothetical protein [Pseudomonas sp. NFIX28]